MVFILMRKLSEYNGLFGISHPDLIYLYSVTLKFDPELLDVEYVVFLFTRFDRNLRNVN